VDARPKAAERTFNSSLVELVVERLGHALLPQPLGTLFANCLPNTLDTTVLKSRRDPGVVFDVWDTFVITGDISAMWLRDSMNQVLPYLRLLNVSVAVGREEEELRQVLFGALHRQMTSILVDPYSNAFTWVGPGSEAGHMDDLTFMEFEEGAGKVSAMQNPRLFERKFELDSVLSPLKLASGLQEVLPQEAAQRFLADPTFLPGVTSILETMEKMTSCSTNAHYTFQRNTLEPTDTLAHGVGAPCRDTGMVRTHFRPSDDAVVFAFNIPGNAMAAVELPRFVRVLEGMAAMRETDRVLQLPWSEGLNDLMARMRQLYAGIARGLGLHGTMMFNGDRVYAYEVDGFGNAIFMDDANVPSLLSLPLLGYLPAEDPLYMATRQHLLSENNPWYFKGKAGIGGIGGPHIGQGSIWPMSLIVQALTSSRVEEVAMLIEQLMVTSAPNSLMHESFTMDNVTDYTRPWFAWANTLFGELILRVATDPVLYEAVNLSEPVDLAELIRSPPAQVVKV